MKEDVHRRADSDEGIRRFRYLYKDVDQAVPNGAAFICATNEMTLITQLCTELP